MIHSCSLLSSRTDFGTSHFSAIPRIAPTNRNRNSFYLCSFSSSCLSYQTTDRRKMRENYVLASSPSSDSLEFSSPSVRPRVGILMGTDSDYPVMKNAAEILWQFNVPYEIKIVSPYRTHDETFSYASSARERGLKIIIAGADGAAHLPGMVAALTPLPVIGVPVKASALDGREPLLSMLKTPRGFPVAAVAIDNSTNAGFLAARILGISDFDLRARISQYLKDARNDVLAKTDMFEQDDLSP